MLQRHKIEPDNSLKPSKNTLKVPACQIFKKKLKKIEKKRTFLRFFRLYIYRAKFRIFISLDVRKICVGLVMPEAFISNSTKDYGNASYKLPYTFGGN